MNCPAEKTAFATLLATLRYLKKVGEPSSTRTVISCGVLTDSPLWVMPTSNGVVLLLPVLKVIVDDEPPLIETTALMGVPGFSIAASARRLVIRRIREPAPGGSNGTPSKTTTLGPIAGAIRP